MQKTISTGSKGVKDLSGPSSAHSRKPQQLSHQPGPIAQLAAIANRSSQVQAQLKLAGELRSSPQVEAQQNLAAQVNAASPGAAQLKKPEEERSSAQIKPDPAAPAKGKLDEKKLTAQTKMEEKKTRQPKFTGAAGPAHGVQGGDVVQCMGLLINWVEHNQNVIAGQVKTTRVGKGGSAHTTAHVVTRRAIEAAILGKDYFSAINAIEFLIREASELPGYIGAKASDSPFVIASIKQAEEQAEKALEAARNEKLPQNHIIRLNELANAYEDITEASVYSRRSGPVGGVGELEGDEEQEKIAETLKTAGGESWAAAAAGLLDTRKWGYFYGTGQGKKVLEDVIVEHVMRLKRTISTESPNPIPDEQIALLIERILQNVSTGGALSGPEDLEGIGKKAYDRLVG